MAYSTGSGAYTDLMAAVLAHAIADGWTEIGGGGSGWPIASPSGRVRGVDWITTTAVQADYTLGGDGLNKTQRFIRLGIGTDGATATANAATGPQIPNMAYSITQWWIFSDISQGEFIHVVYNFSNGVNADCYGHFSFGEIDKGGLTYGSIAYATSSDRRGYAASLDGGVSAPDASLGGDWNTINRTGNMWAGNYGEVDDGWSSFSFMTHSTTAPHLNGSGGWPAWDTWHNSGNYFWAKNGRGFDSQIPNLTADQDASYVNMAWFPPFNTQTGFVGLGPIFMVMINGTTSTARNMFVGVAPNVRFCSVNGIAPGAELTIGSDTWVVFPVLRKTDWNELNVGRHITSGYTGYAYKKVV